MTRARRVFCSRAAWRPVWSAGDILEFDLDGNAIEPRGRALYVERFIHSEIYKAHPDIRAVVHSHSPSIIPFGATDVPLRADLHMSSFLGAASRLRDPRGRRPRD
jgi:HCOMODA/2-hydroxy-3-carboxy-muconic semialdehyde decarboxylase